MSKWNLDDLHKLEDTEKIIKELKEKVKEFKKFKGELGDTLTPERFIEILKEKEKISIITGKLAVRAGLWLSENTSDSKRNSHNSKTLAICTEAANEIMFFSLWFKNLENADKYLKASDPYKYALEQIRLFKEHTLQEKEEQIINLKDLTGSDELCNIYDIIVNRFKFDWNGKMLTLEEVNRFRQSMNRDERVKAYTLVLKRYEEEESVLGEIYQAIVNDWRNENIKLRGFKNPISVRNKINNIPDDAIKILINVTRKNNHLFQEYLKLKEQIIGQKLDRFDLIMPYKEESREYNYEDSQRIVLETYKQFSEEAYEHAKKIFDEKHVHSDKTENKRMGAFCSSVTTDVAPYILLNHNNKLYDLFTMMHEFGHGIHDLLAMEKQTNFTFSPSLPMAETASLFGENLLARKLLKESTPEEKITVLMKMIENQYAAIPLQMYYIIFEMEAHDMIANGATIEELNELFLKLTKEQFGTVMKVDDVFKNIWKYVPHIYHTPFYCYAYAFGNLLVLSLVKKYQNEGEEFIPKYLKILQYGGSKAPADILAEVDIDINKEEFWQQGFDVIKEEIEQLKELIK